MRNLLKSSFLWQFGGGFVLGAIGLMALHPADARHTLVTHLAPATVVSR